MAGHTVCALRVKKPVPYRSSGMAAETEVGNALMGQHMPVRTAVDFVTRCTSFYTGCSMFIKKGASFIRMAFQTGFMLKPAQPFSCCWLMRVMAGCATEHTLLQSVPLVQFKLRKDILMADGTVFDCTCSQKIRPSYFRVHDMTGGTIHGGFPVRASQKS